MTRISSSRTVHLDFILDPGNPLFSVVNSTGWVDEIHHKWIVFVLGNMKRKQVFIEAHCM
jgi:hypothetical protein